MKQKKVPASKSTTNKNINILLIILASVYFSLFFLYEQNMTNFDYGKLVKYGEVIMEKGEVFSTNYFSYTHPDYPFVNHHWGSGLIFYFVHHLFGFGGLTILALLLNLAALLLIIFTANKIGNTRLNIFAILLTLPLLVSRNDPRPEAFSIFFFALSIFLLLGFYKNSINKYWLLLLPLIQLLWINLHILFFFGLFLQLIFLVQVFLTKDKKSLRFFMGFIFILSFGFSFINPFFAEAVFYPLKIMGDINYPVEENMPLFTLREIGGYPPYFIHFEILFGLSLLLIYFWVRNFDSSRNHLYILACLLFFGLLTLYRIRASVFFAYIFIIFISQTVSFLKVYSPKKINKTSNFLIFASIAFILMIPLFHYYPYGERGVRFGTGINKKLDDAAVFFKNYKLSGPVFNNFDIGDYLIYNLYPNEKVFVDSRPEAYPKIFFGEKLLPAFKNEKKWLELDHTYDFNTIFLALHPQVKNFIYRRLYDSQWFVVFYDRYSIIFVKNNAINNKIIRNDLIRKRNIEILKQEIDTFGY